MQRLKKILVAVKGSRASVHALKESIALAQWGKGRVTVIAVGPPYEGDLSLVGVTNIKDTIRGWGGKILNDAVNLAETFHAEIDVIYEEGTPYKKIVEHAENEKSDVIVVGVNRGHSLAEVFGDGTIARVIRRSRVDILAIPVDAPIGWERIFLATKGYRIRRNAAARAVSLARSYGGELKTMWVPSPQQRLRRDRGVLEPEAVMNKEDWIPLEQFHGLAEACGVRHEPFRREGGFATAVCSMAREHNATIMILGWDEAKGLRNVLGGKSVASIIRRAPCPVLTVKAPYECDLSSSQRALSL